MAGYPSSSRPSACSDCRVPVRRGTLLTLGLKSDPDLFDAPPEDTLKGVRDRAILATLVYCRRKLQRREELGAPARSNLGRARPQGSRMGRPNARSKARTVEGAAAHRRARIKMQGGVTAPAVARRKEMGGLNAAIDVGKHQLDVALGSNGELFAE
jgi:hypothetical protein